MANVAQYNWLPQDTAAISALQTTAGAGNLLLNGTLSITGNSIVELKGISRQISLTSTANLSALNFTITGTYLGSPQTETLAGPNSNSVETTKFFNTITSVSVNGAVGTNVSIGTGASGHTNPFKVDEHCTVQALSAQVIVETGGTNLAYTFLSTLQPFDANFSVNNGFHTMYNMIASTDAITIGSHGTISITATGAGAPTYNIPLYCHLPIKYCWIHIDGTLGAGTNGSLLAYILSQGLK